MATKMKIVIWDIDEIESFDLPILEINAYITLIEKHGYEFDGRDFKYLSSKVAKNEISIYVEEE